MATVPASDYVTATVEFGDAYGNTVAAPAFVSVPAWAVDNAELVVTAAADGLSATVVPSGVVVTGALVSVSYDTGAGAVSVTSEGIDVVAGAVTTAAIKLSAPVAK